jgi:hypothetical protein
VVGDPLDFTHQQQEMLRFAAIPFGVVTRALLVHAASSFRSKLTPLPPTISTNIFCRSSKLSPWNIQHRVGRSGLPLYPSQRGQWTHSNIYIKGDKTGKQTSYLVFHIVHHGDHLLHKITKFLFWEIKKIRTNGQGYF